MDSPQELLDLKPPLSRLLKELRGSEPQYAIAKRCGINSKLWSRYERGKVMPRERTLHKIARGCGMTPKVFMRRLFNEHLANLDHLPAASEIRDRPNLSDHWDGDAPNFSALVDYMFDKRSGDRQPDSHAYKLAFEALTQLSLAFQLK